MPTELDDPIAIASDEPNVEDLIDEFTKCGTIGDYYARMQTVDDTRLCRWEGQSEDGKKHDANMPNGQPAFPWDGASDMRCYQADQAINEEVAMLQTSFWRSEIRVSGVEPSDATRSSGATTFLHWYRECKARDELMREAELSAQFAGWYGGVALFPSWKRELGYRAQRIKMDDLLMAAQAAMQTDPDNIIASFPNLVEDVELEGLAVRALQVLYRAYLQGTLPSDLQGDVRDISKSKARGIVRDLRENGMATLPMPYLCKNYACVRALKPLRDIFVPWDTTDIQSARAIFIREFYSESELRSIAASDHWDKAWLEEAIKTKGHSSIWASTGTNGVYVTPSYTWQSQDYEHNRIEVIWALVRQVDEDGIPGVYCTIFSAHTKAVNGVEPGYAKHGLYEYAINNEYPIVWLAREYLDRTVLSSRGIPEICLTSQRERKVLRDAAIDLTSITTLPPINTYKGISGQAYKFGPAIQNIVTPGREPKALDLPTKGLVPTVEMLQENEKEHRRYFGQLSEDTPPALSQMLMEPKVNRFLGAWAKAFKMVYALTEKFAPEVIERVTGMPAQPQDESDYDLVLHFNIAQLNPDILEKHLNAISAMLPEDSAGVIDRAKLVNIKLRLIDPALAREVMTDTQGASQQIFRQVNQDIMSMALGNPAPIVDASNDATAPMKLNYTQQITGSNPKYLMSLTPEVLQLIFGQNALPMMGQMQQQGGMQSQPDPMFSTAMMQYVENLQMGKVQQENKIVGRTGTQQAA